MADEPKGTGPSFWYGAASQVTQGPIGNGLAIGPPRPREEVLEPVVKACREFQAWLKPYLAQEFVERDGTFLPDALEGGWSHKVALAEVGRHAGDALDAIKALFCSAFPDTPFERVELAFLPLNDNRTAKDIGRILEALIISPPTVDQVALFDRLLEKLDSAGPSLDNSKKDGDKRPLPVPTDADEFNLWGALANNAAQPRESRRTEADIAREFPEGERLLEAISARVRRKKCRAWK